MQNGIYIILYVTNGYEDITFLSMEILNRTKVIKKQLTVSKMETYLLWYKRFNYFGLDKI